MKVKELNKQERPREKALDSGIKALSNRELIALLFRCGTRYESAMDLADKVLNSVANLGELSELSILDMMQIKGIKQAKAISLQAAFELGRRTAYDDVKQQGSIECPEDIVTWLNMEISFSQQEQFMVVFLNQRNHVITYRILFKGTLTNASVHPREIFKVAMQVGCARILCIHNHPSGDPSPSEADIQLTRSIEESGQMVSIPLMDHIIVAQNRYVSFRQLQLLE